MLRVPLSLSLLSVLALSTLLTALQCSICRGFVTAELVPRYEDESARTMGVLDVDGYKERFNVKKTHTRYQDTGIVMLLTGSAFRRAQHPAISCSSSDLRGGFRTYQYLLRH